MNSERFTRGYLGCEALAGVVSKRQRIRDSPSTAIREADFRG